MDPVASGTLYSASRQRTFEVPRTDDSGLAEWASKIRQLQQEVDSDAEAEQRRLEDVSRALLAS